MIAIFLFAVAGLMVIGTAIDLFYLAPSPNPPHPAPVLAGAVAIVLVAVMIAGGIGLLFAKPWARWSCVAIFALLTFGGLTRTIVPLIQQHSTETNPQGLGAIFGQLIVYAAFTMPWLYLAFNDAAKSYFAPPPPN